MRKDSVVPTRSGMLEDAGLISPLKKGESSPRNTINISPTKGEEMLTTWQATIRFFSRADRLGRLRAELDRWSFVNSDHPAEVYLTDLFPKLAMRSISLSVDVQHHFELPYGERIVIAAIAELLVPVIIFEFGTYSGSTTTLLANAAPGAVVHTLDLPADEIVWGQDVVEAIGKNFRDRPEYAGRIISHRCNSRLFDFSPFEKKVDLVYIDGSHEFAVSSKTAAMRCACLRRAV